MRYNAYVLVFDGTFLRFGSYSKASPTDNLLSATLYSRLCDAQKKRKGDSWIRDQPVQGNRLRIKQVTLELVEEKDVS